jgi:hypothetical protein
VPDFNQSHRKLITKEKISWRNRYTDNLGKPAHITPIKKRNSSFTKISSDNNIIKNTNIIQNNSISNIFNDNEINNSLTDTLDKAPSENNEVIRKSNILTRPISIQETENLVEFNNNNNNNNEDFLDDDSLPEDDDSLGPPPSNDDTNSDNDCNHSIASTTSTLGPPQYSDDGESLGPPSDDDDDDDISILTDDEDLPDYSSSLSSEDENEYEDKIQDTIIRKANTLTRPITNDNRDFLTSIRPTPPPAAHKIPSPNKTSTKYDVYDKMKKLLPEEAVRHKMKNDCFNQDEINIYFNTKSIKSKPPPPPPPTSAPTERNLSSPVSPLETSKNKIYEEVTDVIVNIPAPPPKQIGKRHSIFTPSTIMTSPGIILPPPPPPPPPKIISPTVSQVSTLSINKRNSIKKSSILSSESILIEEPNRRLSIKLNDLKIPIDNSSKINKNDNISSIYTTNRRPPPPPLSAKPTANPSLSPNKPPPPSTPSPKPQAATIFISDELRQTRPISYKRKDINANIHSNSNRMSGKRLLDNNENKVNNNNNNPGSDLLTMIRNGNSLLKHSPPVVVKPLKGDSTAGFGDSAAVSKILARRKSIMDDNIDSDESDSDIDEWL